MESHARQQIKLEKAWAPVRPCKNALEKDVDHCSGAGGSDGLTIASEPRHV